MLIKFSIRNFKTFRDKVEISLIASNYDKFREDENIIKEPKFGMRLLKSAVIYGANASGKSKLIEAFGIMRKFVINSSKDSQKGEPIPVSPYMFDERSQNQSSEFEVVFIYKNDMYRYGFESTSTKVVAEWLYYRPNTKEIQLFYRDEMHFDIHKRSFPKGLSITKENLVRPNALLLSVAAQFNDKRSGDVLEWFKRFKIISGLHEEGYQRYTMGKTKENDVKIKILELLKVADFGIDDIRIKSMEVTDLPKNMPKEIREMIERKVKEDKFEVLGDVITTHKQYDLNHQQSGFVNLSLGEDESSGTQKFYALTGPILDVIKHGYVFVVDELDSKLHPNLICKIVELFNSQSLNPLNAQLIFNTHDTNLLSSGLFRRDQVWFTEKDRFGAATLYSLSDFKSKVRKDEKFEDNYIAGKYGAIPYLGDFTKLFDPYLIQPIISKSTDEE
jgi:AAA15 family ATPase/GTPase